MSWLQQVFESPYTEKFGLVLLHSLWQIVLVAIVVKASLGLASDRVDHRSSNPKSYSPLRYRVAFGGLLLVCLLPIVTWLTLANPAAVDMAASPKFASPSAVPTGQVEVTQSWLALKGMTDDPNQQQAVVQPVLNDPHITGYDDKPNAIASWAAVIWLSGIVLFAIRPSIGLRAAARLRRRSNEPVPEWLEKSLLRLSQMIGVRQKVRLVQSRFVEVPTLVGIVRPTILLPFSCLTILTADELDSVLLHELAHVRRLDQVANLLQLVIETLFFYHPLVWWMSRVVRQERENCCDDMAVAAAGGQSRSLVSALLSLEEGRVNKPVVGAMASNGGSLIQRVKRLVDTGDQQKSSKHSIISTCVVMLILLAGLGSSVLLADAKDSSAPIIDEFSKSAEVNKSLDERYGQVEIESLNELYTWDTLRSDDPRLIHRLWNIATPELRNQAGRQVDGWKPDLVLRFTQAAAGTKPFEVVIQVRLTDGVQWSIGNGIWDMPSQWPIRYSLAALGAKVDQKSKAEGKSNSDEHLNRERLFNTNAYEQSKKSLLANHHGKWVAIVDGRILASFASFEECRKAADEANRFADHRFIFRPGVDDVDMEFAYSPWITGQPNWWQLGRQFRMDHEISVAVDRWVSKGHSQTSFDGKGTIGLAVPGEASSTVSRWTVASGMISQQLTITEEDVSQMRLQRFAIPGTVNCLTYQQKFERVQVGVTIPELKISTSVAAFVAPSELVKKDPPKPNSSSFQFVPVVDQDQPDSETTGGKVQVQDLEGLKAIGLAGQEDDANDVHNLMELLANSPSKTVLPTGSDPNAVQTAERTDGLILDVRQENETPNDKSTKSKVEVSIDETTGTITLTGDPDHVAKVRRVLADIINRKKATDDRRPLEEMVDQELINLTKQLVGLKPKLGESHPKVVELLNKIAALQYMRLGHQESQTEKEQRQKSIADVRSNITKLELNRSVLAEKYGPRHPNAVAIERQIDTWKQYLSELEADPGRKLENFDDYRRSGLESKVDISLQDIRAGVTALEARRVQLLEKYGPKHPEVVAVTKQLEMWKEYVTRLEPNEEKKPESNNTEKRSLQPDKNGSWIATGRITDAAGFPLKGVRVWASCGIGSLQQTGSTLTKEDGTYQLEFYPGFRQFVPNDFTKSKAPVQAATIFASMDGYSEVNLCRGGDRLMADKPVTEKSSWGEVDEINKRLIVKNEPATINFTMKPATNVQGYLVDSADKLMGMKSLSLNGKELPPSSSVLGQVSTDLNGRFVFKNVPVDRKWNFEFTGDDRKTLNTKDVEFSRDNGRPWLIKVGSDGRMFARRLDSVEANKWAQKANENSLDEPSNRLR